MGAGHMEFRTPLPFHVGLLWFPCVGVGVRATVAMSQTTSPPTPPRLLLQARDCPCLLLTWGAGAHEASASTSCGILDKLFSLLELQGQRLPRNP